MISNLFCCLSKGTQIFGLQFSFWRQYLLMNFIVWERVFLFYFIRVYVYILFYLLVSFSSSNSDKTHNSISCWLFAVSMGFWHNLAGPAAIPTPWPQYPAAYRMNPPYNIVPADTGVCRPVTIVVGKRDHSAENVRRRIVIEASVRQRNAKNYILSFSLSLLLCVLEKWRKWRFKM